MVTQSDWFLQERSEALVSLLLTNREDVAIRRDGGRDSAVDLIVELKDGGKEPATMLLLAQVKGTLHSNRAEWENGVREMLQAGPYHLPTCVFMVNVRDNHAEYAWLAEPRVEGKSAQLVSNGSFQTFDQQAVDQIVSRVKAWYQALPSTAAA